MSMLTTMSKEAGAAEATRQFFGRVMSRVPAQGAAGLAQKLFSNRVKPSDNRFFSRVNFTNAVRDAVFGSPIDVARELRAYGRTPNGFSPGQALKRFYYRSVVPSGSGKTFGSKALRAGVTAANLAMPALEMYGAVKVPPEQRGEAVGRAMGSIALSPFTMRLGIPGMFLDSAAANLGGAVGRRFDPKPLQTLPNTNATPNTL